MLFIDQDAVLDPAAAERLGYAQLVLAAGEYPVDYSGTAFGATRLAAPAADVLAIGPNADGTWGVSWWGVGWVLQTSDDPGGPWVDAEVHGKRPWLFVRV